jgi:hypothetical protein
MRDTRSIHYLKFWNLVFSHLLNWTEEQVEQWALHWSDFDDPSSLFFHESASYYASGPILRPIANAEDTRHRVASHEMQRLLYHVERQMVIGEEIDWSEVRAEINKILGEAQRV